MPTAPNPVTPPDQSWTGVSPDLLKAKNRALLIGFIIFFVVAMIPLLIWKLSWLLVFPAVVVVICAVNWPRNFFEVKNTAYLVRENEVLVRTGALSRTTTALPLGRIQRVDLQEGPIDSSFGLAQLTFESAAESGSVSIPGLPVETAKALRDSILSAAASQRIDL